MKQQVLIIDDEMAARRLIRQYLEAYEEFEILGEADNGLEAVVEINRLEPDLVFLDIKMPGLSGLQVVQQVVHVPQLVFTTAYDQYAIKAFDANAIDYLLKPYTRDRFDKAIRKIRQQRSNFDDARRVAALVVGRQHREAFGTILVESGTKMISIALKDVICIEADKDYTWLHTSSKSYLSSYGIGQLEQRLLLAGFLRVHRSFMINLQHIKEVHKDGVSAQVITSNDKSINVSRTYMPELKKLMY